MQGPVTLYQKYPISKNSVCKDQKFGSKNWQKNRQKNIAGLRPALPPYGAAPLPPTQVGGKCLVAVVLDDQDRTLCLFTIQKEEELRGDGTGTPY